MDKQLFLDVAAIASMMSRYISDKHIFGGDDCYKDALDLWEEREKVITRLKQTNNSEVPF